MPPQDNSAAAGKPVQAGGEGPLIPEVRDGDLCSSADGVLCRRQTTAVDTQAHDGHAQSGKVVLQWVDVHYSVVSTISNSRMSWSFR